MRAVNGIEEFRKGEIVVAPHKNKRGTLQICAEQATFDPSE